ncbi:MAG: C4-type zinc ribbon domain-containing protein [bacterium]
MEVNIREELMLLVDLQDIDDQLRDLELDRGDLPMEVERLQGETTQLGRLLEEQRTELNEIKHEIAHVRGATDEARTKLKKYEQQLYSVKTTREYDAITVQIETAKNSATDGEEKVLRLLSRENSLTSDIAAKEAEVIEIAEAYEAKSAELRAKLEETEAEELELRHRRETIVMRLKKPIYAHYERIRLAKDGRGIARLVGSACGGCFAVVPPQRHLDIRDATDIVLCETCGRILTE